MEASTVFKEILNKVETSQLNYLISKTPFSANIAIKSSFIKYHDARSSKEPRKDESEKTSFENLKYSSDLVKLKEQNKKLTISNLATHLSECSELGLLVVNTLDEHTTKETKTPINVVPPFSPPPSLAPHLFPQTLFPPHPFSPLVGFQKEVSCYFCDDKFPHEVVLKDHYEKVYLILTMRAYQ